MRVKITGYLDLDDGYAAGTGLSDAGYSHLTTAGYTLDDLEDTSVEIVGEVDESAAPPPDPKARPWYRCGNQGCLFKSQNQTLAKQHHNPDLGHKVARSKQ